MAEKIVAEDDGNGNGILLYYKYASVPDVDSLVGFYETNCRSLDLLGRVRIGPDGVNVTVRNCRFRGLSVRFLPVFSRFYRSAGKHQRWRSMSR